MRPSTIVISDWLANFRTEQWTPFEAAIALKDALTKEGYVIVPVASDGQELRQRIHNMRVTLSSVVTLAESGGVNLKNLNAIGKAAKHSLVRDAET